MEKSIKSAVEITPYEWEWGVWKKAETLPGEWHRMELVRWRTVDERLKNGEIHLIPAANQIKED